LSKARCELRGTADQLSVLMHFVQRFRADTGLSDADAFAIELALEELFMNVVLHGSEGLSSPARVAVQLSTTTEEVLIEVEDDGTPFDPLTAPAPDLSLDLDQRPVGGLGLHLIREMMNHVDYQFVRGRNRVLLRKTRAP
jgi:anti-sigma regulatory factor (Ser/Thr protein kinase)